MNQMNTSNRNGLIAIAFDTWALATRFRNMGIYVYARNLLSNFREIANRHSIEFRPLVSSAVSNDANQFEAAMGFQPQQTRLLKLDRSWRFGAACLSAFINRADLLFCPSGNTLPLNPLVPMVTTIHDVTPVVFPAYPRRLTYALRFAFGNSARFSRAIVTDSVCSKQDLIRAFGVPESKVHVVYLGYDDSIFNNSAPDHTALARLRTTLGLKRPYVLHHGTIQPRKNLKRLIEAYRLMLSQNRNLDLDLVLVGQLGWQYEEVLAAANLSAEHGRVVLAGPQSDPNLAVLLKGASLAVIPSLYEGFCLPMVEAMACGTPTICSNTSCLPEISGGVLQYFDPRSVPEIAESMAQALEDGRLRQNLTQRGLERASHFSWLRCAEETLGILKSVAAN